MLKKSLKACIGVTLALSIVLTGCGGSSNVGKESDVKSGEKTAATETTVAETKRAEPVKLKFLGFKTGKEEGAIPELIKKFESENQNVTVEYEGIPTTGGYDDVLKTRLAAGDEMDVFMSQIAYKKLFADANYIMDLSDQKWVGNLTDTMKKHVDIDGKSYCFPIETAGLGMFANMTLLEKNGLSLPANFNEMLEVCEKLKNAKATPFILGNKTGWSGAIILNNGVSATFFNEDEELPKNIAEGKANISEVYMPMLKKYMTLVDKGYINADSCLGMEFNDQAVTEYAKGNSAFLIGGTWMISQIKDARKEDKFVFAPIPVQDEGAAKAFLLPGGALFVNSKTKNTELCKQFVDFWAQDDNLSIYLKSQGSYTTLKGGKSTDEPEAKPFADAIAANQTCIDPQYPNGFNPDTWTPLTKGVQLMAIKKSDPEKVGQQMDEAVKKSIALSKK